MAWTLWQVLAIVFAYFHSAETIQRIDKEIQMSTALEGHTFLTIPGISLLDCWKSCKDRVSCKSVNYWRRMHSCELNSNNGDTVQLTKKPGSVFYSKTRNNDELACGNENCNNGQVCEAETCKVKECMPLQETNAIFYQGNLSTVGSKVLGHCRNGYSFKNGSDVSLPSECGTNGTWFPRNECEKTCDLLPFPNMTQFWNVDNGVLTVQNCATGTAFNVTTCQCSDRV